MIGARNLRRTLAAPLRLLALGCWLAVVALQARAEDAAPRQIAPDLFAPTPRDAATIAAPHPVARDRITPPPPTPPPPPSAPPPLTPVVAPTRERPLGACDRAARDWLPCLAATARLSDGAVANTEAGLLAGLDRRPSLNPVTREAIARALAGAEEAWRSLRERECADLALLERGPTGSFYEARLVCRIRRNLERVDALSTRYGEEP